MRYCVLFFLALLLNACATLPHPISDAEHLSAMGTEFEGMATILVFRDEGKAGMGWPINVNVDGETKGTIRRQDYVKFSAAGGRHVLMAAWPKLSGEPDVAVSAQFESGRTYYFAFNTGIGSTDSGMAMMADLAQIGDRDAKVRLVNYTKK